LETPPRKRPKRWRSRSTPRQLWLLREQRGWTTLVREHSDRGHVTASNLVGDLRSRERCLSQILSSGYRRRISSGIEYWQINAYSIGRDFTALFISA
jgi:hypothetical protein